MDLKTLRINKKLSQVEASSICHIPLRTYKRLENDNGYKDSCKYELAVKTINEYFKKQTKNKQYKIVVIGAGYVGFSLGVLLSLNNHVSVVDINPEKVYKINQKKPLFKDAEIENCLKNKKPNLVGYLPDQEVYKGKDFIIISLPTNTDEKTGMLDTGLIKSTIEDIRKVNKKALIVIKSTCYVGFTESLGDKDVIFCPEFLREGRALSDNLYPSRIIIGGDKKNIKVKRFANLLFSSSHNRPCVLYVKPSEAEAIKLFSNAYLAMRVAYFNELDSFAIKNGLDSNNIVQGVSLDQRIGDYYNNPSFGYGGYCLPKDTLSLISQIDDDGLISSIDRSNNLRKRYIVDDILSKLDKDSVVGVYKIQSKMNSDNTRHAAILDVIDGLKNKGIKILYYDESISLEQFKKQSDIVLANRYDSSLDDIKYKVYTRDLFARD